MRPTFPLFQSHLDLAHELWKKLVTPEATVVDATCGNGHDAEVLATLAYEGKLILFDIQSQAIENSRERLRKAVDPAYFETISFYQLCHSKIDEIVAPSSATLIIFNLGYLPGQDKSITTEVPSTLSCLEKCINLVRPGGAISLTCYPGHDEGKKELEAIIQFCGGLSPKEWSVSSHSWLNRTLHPHLIFLQKGE